MCGGRCWCARECGGEDGGMVGLESSTRAGSLSVCRDPLSGAGAEVVLRSGKVRQPRARQQMAAAMPASQSNRVKGVAREPYAGDTL